MRVSAERKEIPDKWYNVIPDLRFPMAPMMGPSGYPAGEHDLGPLMASSTADQELEREKREMAIPEEVRDLYSNWRPTPLYRAERFEESLKTPARIFYKYEGGNPSGSHEMNTAIAQAYYASQDKGVKRMVTATGNGEWGQSLAIACNYFGLKCKVYMVRSSYEQRANGRYAMEILGAEVVPSPSDNTRTGKEVLAQKPDSPGSLSTALSEAFEEAVTHDDIKLSWGTVMNHVVLHQTIIGLEAKSQMRRADAEPDIIISAVGGGSGFGGLVLPFYRNLRQGMRMLAVETASAPSLCKGRYAYDHADAEGLSPMLKMYTLGRSFVPSGVCAGGMGYHGISPIISALYREKEIEAKAYTQRQAFEAAIAFARTEGVIPSPESSYAERAVMDEALACKDSKERKDILFLLDANSNLDLAAFRDFVEGAIGDEPFPEGEVQMALEQLPDVKSE